MTDPYRPAPSPADRARALRHTKPALELCQWENLEYDLEKSGNGFEFDVFN